jgi:hypothetical protein
LKEARVATASGSSFGIYGEGYICISYASLYNELEETLDRIEKAVKHSKWDYFRILHVWGSFTVFLHVLSACQKILDVGLVVLEQMFPRGLYQRSQPRLQRDLPHHTSPSQWFSHSVR